MTRAFFALETTLGTANRTSGGAGFSMNAAIGILAAILCIVAMTAPACAESAGSLVAAGNALYAAGEYDKALEAYDKALAAQPDSAEILFDRGNALFRKGEYDKALEAYQAAALHANNLSLEASAHFNIGNASFMKGQKQLESDPRKTISQWGESIRHYQEAVRIDPEFKEAAQNIEVVRLTMKDLADRIKKAEEAAREQRERLEEAQKVLKEVIKEQESEVEANRTLQQERTENPGEAADQKIRQLASDQERTLEKTGDVAKMLKALERGMQQGHAPQQPPDSSPENVQEHMEKAGEAQRSAVEKLERQELDAALKDQEEAADHLRKALGDSKDPGNTGDKPTEPEKNDNGDREKSGNQEHEEATPQGKPGEHKESGKKGVEGRPPQDEKSPGTQKENAEKGSDLKKDGAFSESPESIFSEEKEHRLRLNRDSQSGYKPVEKDW